METEIAATLAELGAQFGFMVYLIAQNKTQSKALDDMRAKYDGLLERAIKALDSCGNS
jgi:hypothetical protein